MKAPMTDTVKKQKLHTLPVSWKRSYQSVTMSSYKLEFIRGKVEAQRLLLMKVLGYTGNHIQQLNPVGQFRD